MIPRSLIGPILAGGLLLVWVLGWWPLVRRAWRARRADFARRELQKMRPVSAYHLRQITGTDSSHGK